LVTAQSEASAEESGIYMMSEGGREKA
jgi:hypothetical protein